jgi:hypothetical protein
MNNFPSTSRQLITIFSKNIYQNLRRVGNMFLTLNMDQFGERYFYFSEQEG